LYFYRSIFKKGKKMKFLISLILSVGLILPVLASSEITVLVPAKPGGLANVQADALRNAAAIKNIKFNITFTGTCQNASRIFKQDQPVVAILATHIYADSRCMFDSLEKKQLLTYLQHQPLMICHRKDRTDLGVLHFKARDVRKSIAVISFFKGVVNNLVQDQQQHHTKVVPVGVSNDLKAQTFLKEFDYFLIDTDYATRNTDRLTCVANTSGQEIYGIPALKTVWSRFSTNNEFYISHMLVTNEKNPDQLKKLFVDLVNSDVWSKYMFNQHGVTRIPNNVDQFEYLKTQSKLLAQ